MSAVVCYSVVPVRRSELGKRRLSQTQHRTEVFACTICKLIFRQASGESMKGNCVSVEYLQFMILGRDDSHEEIILLFSPGWNTLNLKTST